MSQDLDTRSTRSARSLNVRIPSTNTPDGCHHVSPPQQFFAGGATVSQVPMKGNASVSQLPSLRLPRIEKAVLAARKIEKAWLGMRDRQLFKLLKHAVCAAEASLSFEILRKVCPKEAELLKDKTMTSKVRLRFGGSEFPPHIFFKIFLATEHGMTVHYVSGKKMIEPASEAARDACQLMGHRRFYDQIISDQLHRNCHAVTDEVDVITLKDYMQYLSLLDETPAYMGGRDNCWRKLTLEVLPRQTIFYDIVQYLYTHKMSPLLLSELPDLLAPPLNEDVQLNQIRIISQMRPVTVTPFTSHMRPSSGRKSSRWSKKAARIRAMKMKRLYETGKCSSLEDELRRDRTASSDQKPTASTQGEAGMRKEEEERNQDDSVEEDDWESEAHKLYEWTQELSVDELVATPRLSALSLTASR